MSTRDLALRTLVIKHVADVAKAAIAQHRDDLATELANGDRIAVTAPDNPALEIGKVWRTTPKGTAHVTDQAALVAWMAEHYPDHTITVERVPDDRWPAALDVLRHHAPHLLETVTTLPGWAEAEVLGLTVRARQACGPGGELDVPGVAYEPPGDGTVTVRLSDDAPTEIERLWRDGRIDLRTGEVLALPSGEPQ